MPDSVDALYVTFSENICKGDGSGMTNCGKIRGVKRPTLTICAMLVTAVHAAQVHPLEIATYEAVRLCVATDPAGDLESCGNSTGRSPIHSAARRALIKMYGERTAFMRGCLESKPIADCTAHVDWLMVGGFTRALEQETAGLTGSLPRSDKRR